MARFFAFFMLFHLSVTFFDRRFPLSVQAGSSSLAKSVYAIEIYTQPPTLANCQKIIGSC